MKSIEIFSFVWNLNLSFLKFKILDFKPQFRTFKTHVSLYYLIVPSYFFHYNHN